MCEVDSTVSAIVCITVFLLLLVAAGFFWVLSLLLVCCFWFSFCFVLFWGGVGWGWMGVVGCGAVSSKFVVCLFGVFLSPPPPPPTFFLGGGWEGVGMGVGRNHTDVEPPPPKKKKKKKNLCLCVSVCDLCCCIYYRLHHYHNIVLHKSLRTYIDLLHSLQIPF